MVKRSTLALPLIVCSALWLLGITGCSKDQTDLVPVSGTVLIDDKPLTFGTIRFIPEGDRSAFGSLDDHGHFTLMTSKTEGCVRGHHKVIVHAAKPLDANSLKWHAPKKYAQASSTDLFVDITGPEDDLKIRITWAGGSPFTEYPNRR